VNAQVEELPENKVRLSVEVPVDDMRHAVDHAASDLAGSVKIPGFRKGKVPMPVLVARVGRERLLSEAVESHIGGWFRNAAARSRIRAVSPPEYDYELPASTDSPFRFTATVDVQPKVEVVDWTTLEVPAAEAEVPEELVDQEIEALRSAVAELAPVEGRPAREGDVVVIDIVGESGEARRDVVVELGSDRLVEELEDALTGMTPGEVKLVEHEVADDSTAQVEVSLREIKEKVLPPVDDDLARTASEFDNLADLKTDIRSRLRQQLDAELEAEFRAAAVDALADASEVSPSAALVDARTNELLMGLVRSLERRGISPETYLAVSNQTPEQLQERMRAEASQAIARELALEAVADRLELSVSDEELREFIRAEAEEAGEENPAEVADRVMREGRIETLREDLRLRNALDRLVSEVQRIPVDLARAREKLWTPGKEKGPEATKLWTPGQEERA
jgi:trigger factor